MSCAKCGAAQVSINQDGKPFTVCPSCDIPDRTCTWCKLSMRKKLVGNGRYVHYICPKCVFQHTSKYTAISVATLSEP
jgi:hypothetical protein